MTNALTTSSTLQQQITATVERLRACGGDGVANALKSLRTGGLSLPSTIKPEDQNTVYSYALSGLSHEALTTACKKLIRGEYDIDRKAFIPTPPELAAMVRAEQRAISDDLSRLRATKEAMEAGSSNADKGTCRDPEARARVKAMLGEFRAWRQSEKETERGEVSPELPPSPEQIAMWEKIMDLPDAKEVGIEQVQYRNAVRAKLAKASQPDEDSTNREAGHFGSRSNDWRGHRLVIDEMNRRAEETR